MGRGICPALFFFSFAGRFMALPVCLSDGLLFPPACVMPTLDALADSINFFSLLSALLFVFSSVALLYVAIYAGGLILSVIRGDSGWGDRG